jgi:hypothetical protein
MSPWEILANIAFMKEHTLPSSSAETMFRHLNRFAAAWEALWGQHGSSTDAIPAYRGLLAALHQQFMHSGVDSVMLRNGMRTIDAVKWWIFQSALPVPSASVSQQRVS